MMMGRPVLFFSGSYVTCLRVGCVTPTKCFRPHVLQICTKTWSCGIRVCHVRIVTLVRGRGRLELCVQCRLQAAWIVTHVLFGRAPAVACAPSSNVVRTPAQIGIGISETENIGDAADEMGDNLQTVNLGGVY